MERKIIVSILIAVVACVLFLVGLILDEFWLRVCCKPFIHMALLVWLGSQGRTRYRDLLFAGLFLCMIGDFLLEFRQSLFLPGVLVFLLGHLAYIAAFVSQEKRFYLERMLPFAVWGGLLFWILQPGLGAMTIPVFSYTIAICIMMWRAAARIQRLGKEDLRAWVTLGGAVLFSFGDTLIALDRFHSPVDQVRYPIILTYWVAQICIIQSAAFQSSDACKKA
jgi:alkenylglycerophosphocholine/alkenylglycerophosphoethanolamine hydrolase